MLHHTTTSTSALPYILHNSTNPLLHELHYPTIPHSPQRFFKLCYFFYFFLTWPLFSELNQPRPVHLKGPRGPATPTWAGTGGGAGPAAGTRGCQILDDAAADRHDPGTGPAAAGVQEPPHSSDCSYQSVAMTVSVKKVKSE
jgi:hypothetical protein